MCLEPRIPGLNLSYPPADGCLEYQSTSCWNCLLQQL